MAARPGAQVTGEQGGGSLPLKKSTTSWAPAERIDRLRAWVPRRATHYPASNRLSFATGSNKSLPSKPACSHSLCSTSHFPSNPFFSLTVLAADLHKILQRLYERTLLLSSRYQRSHRPEARCAFAPRLPATDSYIPNEKRLLQARRPRP